MKQGTGPSSHDFPHTSTREGRSGFQPLQGSGNGSSEAARCRFYLADCAPGSVRFDRYPKPNAFTLVEALVAIAVSSIVIIGIYQVWIGTTKQEEGNLARIESFQTAQLALDYIQSDFARLFVKDRADLGPFANLTPRAQLELDTSVSLGTSGPKLYRPERITYALESDSGDGPSWLTRNGRRISNVKLKSLQFLPRMVDSLDGSRKVYLMEVRLTALDSSGKLETPLVGLYLAPVLTENRATPWWPQDAVPYKE